ncbi:hypothetical protein [Ruegeria arenilitoris]|uniref:hypothetical protein n=1 Tax=Ruegeria arenilitoris TaxID=1173585 RepID=UPI001CFD4850|nr:hypothetical protein [Ruegeria arenilitoris]
MELVLEKSLSERSSIENKSEFRDFTMAFANVLMKSIRLGRAPIDLFSSVAYPANQTLAASPQWNGLTALLRSPYAEKLTV